MRKQKTWLSARKVIGLLIFLGLAAITVYFLVLYSNIVNSKMENKEDLSAFIKAETDIHTITKMYHFQGEEAYDIIYGQDKSEKSEYVIFNPSGNKNKDDLLTYKADDLISEKSIEKEWQSTCKGCTLKRSSPAMINDKPLWEMTYINDQNRYVMEYISLKDGSTFEKLGLKLKYN